MLLVASSFRGQLLNIQPVPWLVLAEGKRCLMALEKTSCDFETYSDEQMPLEHTGNRGTPYFFPGAVIFTISATFRFSVQIFSQHTSLYTAIRLPIVPAGRKKK
jgi:hypothetical protein